ncbi:hypothetical protein F5X96DRAFT_14111 [Biscogniauxia mediterranea]|nr:hypothetical protein F5X96DRAFT_14111 [Biscogniauxia mediterranea]
MTETEDYGTYNISRYRRDEPKDNALKGGGDWSIETRFVYTFFFYSSVPFLFSFLFFSNPPSFFFLSLLLTRFLTLPPLSPLSWSLGAATKRVEAAAAAAVVAVGSLRSLPKFDRRQGRLGSQSNLTAAPPYNTTSCTWCGFFSSSSFSSFPFPCFLALYRFPSPLAYYMVGSRYVKVVNKRG